MIIAAATSGSKGGTGKSTLSSLLALRLSKKYRVLLVDMGEGGSSTRLVLGQDPGPPYLVDYFAGKTDWKNIICQSPYSHRLYVAPSPPKIRGPVDPYMLYDMLVALKKHVQIVIIDLPAYPGSLYDPVVDMGHLVLLLMNPDPLSFEAAKQAYTGRGLVLPVLNKYHPVHREWLDKAKEHWNVVFAFPFDPALTFSKTRTLPEAYKFSKEETKKDLALLAQRLLKPFVKISR